MTGRADIEGQKVNVAMNAYAATQVRYACGGGGVYHGLVGWVQ